MASNDDDDSAAETDSRSSIKLRHHKYEHIDLESGRGDPEMDLVIGSELLETQPEQGAELSVAKEGGEEFVDDDTVEFDHTYNDKAGKITDFANFHDYYLLMKKYPGYRYYYTSHLCQHIGDWFVRIASLLMVDELAHNSGSSLAYLQLTRLLPTALFSQVGGFLADNYDRKRLMITLDLLNGVAVLGYLISIHYQSIDILFLISTLRSSISSTYYPVTQAMVPLLIVNNPRDLQLAVTMNNWAWCTMAVVGGIVAGTSTAFIGIQTCYIIDCLTFFLSAIVVAKGIHGNFNPSCRIVASHSNKNDSSKQHHVESISTPISSCTVGRVFFCRPLCNVCNQAIQLSKYLWGCGFGLLVLLRGSAALVWGPEDIIGVLFATVDNNEVQSSINMGMLFSTIGLGCFLGPLFVIPLTDAYKPITLQRAFWIGMVVLTLGWMVIAQFSTTYYKFLCATLLRTIGSGIAWTYSTMILQTLCEPAILGRVLSVELSINTILEALSTWCTGALKDDRGFDKQMLAWFAAALGVGVVLFWGIYHFVLRRGAASSCFNSQQYHLANKNKDVVQNCDNGISKKQIELEMTIEQSACGGNGMKVYAKFNEN